MAQATLVSNELKPENISIDIHMNISWLQTKPQCSKFQNWLHFSVTSYGLGN